jgi:hypothetical protein
VFAARGTCVVIFIEDKSAIFASVKSAPFDVVDNEANLSFPLWYNLLYLILCLLFYLLLNLN